MNKRGNYAFIDSQNLNMGTQKAGWKMDWRKFRKFLQEEHNVTSAFMFIGYITENQDLYNQLETAGYRIILTPTVDQKGDELTKGNIDADLVLWAMKELPNYEKAIIVSGDGDFYGLAEYLAVNGRLLNIMTPNWQYSSLLKPFDKYIVRIDKLKNKLAYHTRRK